MTEPADPLLLGQRVVAILETGLRTATYKLATLMALLEHCVENLPTDPTDVLDVPIPELAHRVLGIYWQQVRPFDGHELRQSTGSTARILNATRALQAAADSRRRGLSVDIARLRAPGDYQRAIDDITLCLAQQPLHRLQKLPGASTSDAFLYDDVFLHDKVSLATLRSHGNAVQLKPGVAHGLARLAGLLKPALEIMWVDDVRRMNKFLDAEVPDVAGHLFGRERTASTVVREPFKEAFGPHCFYCRTHLPANNPIDHVLPWSMAGIDGLANLVLACARCNGDKSGALPAIGLVDRVLDRDVGVLEEMASSLQWPTQRSRVVAAARGIYLGQPRGCRRGRGIGAGSGWMSALRRGGWEREAHGNPADRSAVIAGSAHCALSWHMSNRYTQIHTDLTRAETAESAEDALRHLRSVLVEVSQLLDEQLARAVVDDEMSIAAAGKSAGLSENAVGPRLANTPRLSPYATASGRITADDVRRARNDKHARTPLPPAPAPEPMRFKPRRNTKPR